VSIGLAVTAGSGIVLSYLLFSSALLDSSSQRRGHTQSTSESTMTHGTTNATAAMMNVSDARAKPHREEGQLLFTPSLYSQRAQLVHNVLQRYACCRIVDAGCSRGDLLLFLMNVCLLSHVQLTHVTAIDIDEGVLRKAAQVLPFSGFSITAYTQNCHGQLLQGNLASCATVPAEWLPYPHPLLSLFMKIKKGRGLQWMP
jgi:hypothetical protein